MRDRQRYSMRKLCGNKKNITIHDVQRIRRSISWNRGRVIPNMPTCIKDVHDAVSGLNSHTDRGEYFVLCNDLEKNIIIFSCDTNLRFLSNCTTYYMDGTFKYSPKYFLQLFTIHGGYNGHYVPANFCILPDKRVVTYETTLKNIKFTAEKMNICLHPKNVVSDFELAIRKSVKSVWPESNVFGCKFHLAQNWFKKK